MGRLPDRKNANSGSAKSEDIPSRDPGGRLRPFKTRDRNPALPQYKRGGFRATTIGEITYRAYLPGDEASILDGFNETFKLTRDLDYWHWKFAAEPLGRFMSVAVDERGMVLAFYAAVPLYWQYDGVRKLAGLGADVYCRRHPDLIRRNTFVETLNHFLDHNMGGKGLSIVFGFAGRTASRLYQHKTSHIGPEPIELYERPANGDIPGEPDPGLRPVHGPQAVALLDRLWPRVALRHPRIAIRDAAWAERRFLNRPDATYDFVALVDETGTPAAWGAFTRDGETFYACDILWDGRPGALEQLDGLFAKAARDAGAARSLMVLQNGGPVAAALLARGWRGIEYPHGGSWIMQTADPQIGHDILDSFYLTYADTDLV